MNVKQAAEKLLMGDVVAIPTETVYGLAAIIGSAPALKKIFTTKQRPLFDPLIVHVLDGLQARELAQEWPREIEALTKTFWPGPLTVVVPKAVTINPLISAGLDTVGLRAPAHPLTRELIQLTGPLAAPSANRFGRTSPTRAEHVTTEFEGAVAVIDGGPCMVGVESTVVRWDSNSNCLEILRPGGVSREQLVLELKKVNPKASVVRATSQASPGHLDQHYQPRLPLILATGPATAQMRTDLANRFGLKVDDLFELQLSPQPELAARELYHRLHELGRAPSGAIIYWRGPEWSSPSWDAIRDRLERASTHRI